MCPRVRFVLITLLMVVVAVALGQAAGARSPSKYGSKRIERRRRLPGLPVQGGFPIPTPGPPPVKAPYKGFYKVCYRICWSTS